MLNILVAIRVWHKKWISKHILIHCDNLAVVTILNTGKTKDTHLATLTQNIWLECAKNDIQIIVTHIMGKSNIIADLLSRCSNSENDKEKLEKLLPQHVWLETTNELLHINEKI